MMKTETNPTYTQKRLLGRADIKRLLGISEATLRRWREDGTLPQPIRFGRRLIRWDAQTIEQWLASRSHEANH